MNENKKWYQLSGSARSNLIVVLIGIAFYLALSNFGVIWSKIAFLLDLIGPFIAGFIIAYLLNAPVNFFYRKVYHRVKYGRGLSILTVYIIAVLILAVLILAIVPSVVESIERVGVLINNMSDYLDNLNQLVQDLMNQFGIENEEGINDVLVTYQDVMEQASEMVKTALPRLVDIGMAVGNWFIAAITAIISSIYMLLSKKTHLRQVKRLSYAVIPKKQMDWFSDVLHNANHIFLRFINGKIIDSAIIGVLCFALCVILRIPFPVLVGVVIGVTNIIPFFGPFIGAIPCVMILVIVDPWAALRFLIMIVALQQFDGNVLGPKILGDSTGLSPLWVLVAIIVGGGLFGFIGMLLGVPVFAVIYAIVRDWVNKRLEKKGLSNIGASEEEKPPEPDN
ncbi:MAG: AI-2E family transporter [Oscillospiraceae bacterium]|nr:AI-2E family transporter [Oscillospiraceae bacterium]